MADFDLNKRGGFTIDRDSLHASEGYKRNVEALKNLKAKRMTDHIRDLDEVVRLAGLATPDVWINDGPHLLIDTREQVCCGRGYQECCGSPDIDGSVEEIGSALDNKDADLIAAAVNYIRQHHAAIRRDAEDAQKWRSMCESVGAEQLVAASEKHGDAMGVLKDAERWRFIVSAPQGCVRTDFVSWLPAYFYWGPNKPLAEQIDAAIAGEKCSADAARESES